MPALVLIALLLLPAFLLAQDPIPVEAPAPIRVCSPNVNPLLQGACADPPRLLNNPEPNYPETARRLRHEGAVGLLLVVGPDGSTRDIHVIKSAAEELDQAAIAAVARWRFEPPTYRGKPTAVSMGAVVTFRLGKGSATSVVMTRGPAAVSSEDFRKMWVDAWQAFGRHDYEMTVDLSHGLATLAPQAPGVHSLLGASLFQLNRLDEAREAFQAEIKIDPASLKAYTGLGRVYRRQHKYEEAAAQYAKQATINPRDAEAYTELGTVLRDEKKCSDAIPELQKALAIAPNNIQALFALGNCEIDLGDTAKGVSELEQATSVSPMAGTWNSAAYQLAKQGVELDRAQKWIATAITIQAALLHNISLDRFSKTQLGEVSSLAAYWDTQGWVYFRNEDLEKARVYTQAAWELRPIPTIGDHLGQVYERLGRKEDAIHTYAMAIASNDLTKVPEANTDTVAETTDRLKRLATDSARIEDLMKRARADLDAMREVTIPNVAKSDGTAAFLLVVADGERITQVRRISGNESLGSYAGALRGVRLPMHIPEGAGIEIPRRGTLTCKTDDPQCHFTLLRASEAYILAEKEENSRIEGATAKASAPGNSRVYTSSSVGMQITMPEEWVALEEANTGRNDFRSVRLGRPGTPAFVFLTHERLEGTADFYRKQLKGRWSRNEHFRQRNEAEVTRDGIPGEHWILGWREKGVEYSAILEFFTVGDDHYWIVGQAPADAYGRYERNFEDMAQSLKFPMLHKEF